MDPQQIDVKANKEHRAVVPQGGEVKVETNKIQEHKQQVSPLTLDQRGTPNDNSEKQKMTNVAKCMICSKKTGLLGFKCRCEGNFCSAHRHAEDHKCGYDYKTDAKNKLAKDNPVIVSAKVTKI